MISELDPHKDIKHWIEAAVRVRHQSGDGQNIIHRGADVTLVERRDIKRCQRFQEHGHVIRRPTQEKSDHDAEDKLDGLGTGV